MPRGGARPNSGPKAKPKTVSPTDKQFAARVLARIPELGLTVKDAKGRDFQIKDDEDYALITLLNPFGSGMDQFNRLIEKRDGKPVSTVNHLHDKPIEHNHTHSLGEGMRIAMEKAELRVTAAKQLPKK